MKGGDLVKIIVAGGRDFSNYPLMKERLDYLFQNIPKNELVIISGMARGADTLALRYASEMGIPVIKMPADWNKYKKSAGYIRNEDMAKIADGLVAFWDGQSRGTANMIAIANSKNLVVHVVRY